MRKNPLNLLLLAGLVAMLPVAGAMAQERPSFYDPASAAAIMLPDGRVCNYVGAEPRPRDLGDPVTYRCSDGRGLRGEVTIDGTYMTVDREGFENLDRDAIIESEDIRFLIAEIELEDGTVCLHAGEGATLAFDGKRLNYTCGGPSVGLIGDIAISAGGVFQVEAAQLDGTSLASSEMVTIKRLGASSR